MIVEEQHGCTSSPWGGIIKKGIILVGGLPIVLCCVFDKYIICCTVIGMTIDMAIYIAVDMASGSIIDIIAGNIIGITVSILVIDLSV